MNPSLVGVVTVYNSLNTLPFMNITTSLRHCQYETYKVGISELTSSSSSLFDSWLGFIPFGKVYTEGVTTEPIVIPPPNQQPVEHLVIESELDCYKLQMKNWLSITVKSMMCNREEWDLDLSQYQNLQKLVVEEYSLERMRVLNITGIDVEMISIGDWSFYYSEAFVLKDLPVLRNVTLGVRSFASVKELDLENTPLLDELINRNPTLRDIV